MYLRNYSFDDIWIYNPVNIISGQKNENLYVYPLAEDT